MRWARFATRMRAALGLAAFIVSASNTLAAHVDALCATARSFERSLVALREAVPEFDAGVLLAFANRLSDYLYILARHLEDGNHLTVDYDRLGDASDP